MDTKPYEARREPGGKKRGGGGLSWLRLRASGWQADMNTQY